MLVVRRSLSMNLKKKQNNLNWQESKLKERSGELRLEVELVAEMVVVGILEIELEETEETIETEIGETVIEIETGETVIETEEETGTEMRDPVHGTVEMEGELEAKMILEMQT